MLVTIIIRQSRTHSRPPMSDEHAEAAVASGIRRLMMSAVLGTTALAGGAFMSAPAHAAINR